MSISDKNYTGVKMDTNNIKMETHHTSSILETHSISFAIGGQRHVIIQRQSTQKWRSSIHRTAEHLIRVPSAFSDVSDSTDRSTELESIK